MRTTDTEMILDKWEDSNESDTKRQTDKIRYTRGYYERRIILKISRPDKIIADTRNNFDRSSSTIHYNINVE